MTRGGDAVTIDIDAALAVRSEPTELERVFVNLLANAHEHGGPNVSVTARRQVDEVIVDVADDGRGVPDDYLQDLFAPFAKRRTAGGDPVSGSRSCTSSWQPSAARSPITTRNRTVPCSPSDSR